MNNINLKEIFQKSIKSIYFKIIGLVLIILILHKFYVWTNTQSTDNAYVEADISIISSEVSGVIKDLIITDNFIVKKDDIVAQIDDEEYISSLAKTEASYSSGLNQVKILEQKILIEDLTQQKYNESLDLAKMNLETATADFARVSNLSKDNYASAKALDTAKTDLEKAKTEYAQAKLNLQISQQNLMLLKVQKEAEEANAKALEQNKNLATRSLKNTKIKAPIDGIVANNNIKIGNYVRPGTPLFFVVPTDKFYVKANFKETQVKKFREGMKVILHFDSASGYEIEGTLRNFSPATGSKFSLIPPDNATGNFTKVVQRVPVLIDFTLNENFKTKLIPGMSVIVEVRTDQ